MIIEIFDEHTGNWIVKKLEETKPVIKEIEKLDALGASSLDYKLALVQVVDEMTSTYLNEIKSLRN